MLLEPIVYWSEERLSEMSNEDFMEHAENNGNVHSLQGFQAKFNEGQIRQGYIRIMWMENNYPGWGVEVSSHGGCKEVDCLPIIKSEQ